jgi:isoquinoline 1-oxidoreductase subunit beta
MSTENKDNTPKKKFSRRKFLTRVGIGLSGTAALLYFGRSPIRRKISGVAADLDLPSGILNFDTDMWFEVNADNTITLKSPKVEMGQGIFTGFAMLAAEELDVALDKIKVVHATTLNGAADLAGTGGSTSTTSLYKDIRTVAATLRETLKLAASKLWNVDPSVITTKDGVLTAGVNTMSYADLAKQTKDWKAAKTPELRPESGFKYVGTEQKRIDLHDKVMGKPIYGIDTDLPNMVYGAALYSPYIGGTLKKVDTSEAQKTAGTIAVLSYEDWVGVVANSRYAAEKAVEKIVAEWDYPQKYSTKDLLNTITVGNGTEVNVQKVGDTEGVLNDKVSHYLKAEYRTAVGAHANMEPSITVADVVGDKVTIYTSYQINNTLHGDVASALGFSKSDVDVRTQFLGGGFGRRAAKHNAVEAAKLSKAVGKPVHLLYTRQQEFQNGYFRPNTHHILRGQLDGNAKLVAVQHDIATADMVLLAISPMAEKALGADFISAGHGARIPYAVPNVRATMWKSYIPFKTGIWRSVGMFANTFVVESFMDEMANKGGVDPLKFRLDHCDDSDLLKRRKAVLTILGEKAGWNSPKVAGVGRGIAVGEDRKSISAAIAEVKIVEGQIKVVKITQIIDAGKIVNPSGVRQQVEGATMQAMSAALFEDIQIEDSQVVQTNFHNYTVAKLMDTPQIEVLMHQGTDKPLGVGEPPMSPVAPAIANAVFNLTGKRLRSLPLQAALDGFK